MSAVRLTAADQPAVWLTALRPQCVRDGEFTLSAPPSAHAADLQFTESGDELQESIAARRNSSGNEGSVEEPRPLAVGIDLVAAGGAHDVGQGRFAHIPCAARVGIDRVADARHPASS